MKAVVRKDSPSKTPERSRPIDMMRVAIICHVYPPEHAPAGIMVSELAQDLAAKGHHVTVLTGWPSHPAGVLFPGWQSKWRSAEQHAGFSVIRCGHSTHLRAQPFWRLWYYVTFGLTTLVNGWRSGPFDSIVCLSTPVFGSWTAWLLARSKCARFVQCIFDLHPEGAANAGLVQRGLLYTALRAADTRLCRLADQIVTLGEGVRGEIAARGISPSLVAIVPFWLDGSKVRPSPRENAWRTRHHILPRTFVALYAGTIGYISGAEVLVETARLLEHRTDILLLCVGDGPVKERLMVAAAEARLTNIQFLPFQPSEVLPQVLATADVGLVSLLPGAGRTSVPSKVLGYLAAARPVIASVEPETDTARLIEQAACGRVTGVHNPQGIASAVLELANDARLREQLGRAGRLHFERFFDRASGVSAYERLLNPTEFEDAAREARQTSAS